MGLELKKKIKHPKDMTHLINLMNNLQEFHLISAGLELGIFEFLEKRALSAEEIANNTGFNTEIMRSWCKAATSCGYLKFNDNKFTLTRWSKAFLLEKSPTYIGYLCKYSKIVPEAYSQLEARFRGNHPLMEAQHALNSVESIAPIADLVVPLLIQNVISLQNKCHILDLGCGLGRYLINFALNNPKLTGLGIDGGWIAEIVHNAKKNVRKHNLQDRIKILLADVMDLELQDQFDVIFMSGFLQAFTLDDASIILKKAQSWLKPNGILILQEMLIENDGIQPKANALLNLFLHLESSQAGLFTYEQLEKLLLGVHFKEIKRIDLFPQITHIIAQ